MKTYNSYLFVDKDPIIDELRTLLKNEDWRKLADASGVSYATLANWFYGDTKRPQHATIMAVLRAAGYNMQIVRETSKVRHLKRVT